MATISELNFNLVGTISAFASTIGYALQNLYTKKTMRDLNIHQHVLLHKLTMYGVFMMFTLWAITDAPRIAQGKGLLNMLNGGFGGRVPGSSPAQLNLF